MRKVILALTLSLVFCAALVTCCHAQDPSTAKILIYPGESLPQLRAGFTTNIAHPHKTTDQPPTPPAGYVLMNYPGPLGSYPAYITTPAAGSGNKKYPAIIWLVGGFDNSIDSTPWTPATPDNDQSASAFKAAGVITMYPSLRGGNNNPGSIEVCYGEVDDVLAAARYLATVSYVDPNRIYLGGHSTGGTLALLVDESQTSTFRAVFSFGPVDHVGEYGTDNLTFDYSNTIELAMRSPLYCLNSIASPTFVFEGTRDPSNIEELTNLSAKCSNPACHFYELPGYDHFSELAEFTPIIAKKIIADTGTTPKFHFILTNPAVVPAPSED